MIVYRKKGGDLTEQYINTYALLYITAVVRLRKNTYKTVVIIINESKIGAKENDDGWAGRRRVE